jgi:hypothetical protein
MGIVGRYPERGIRIDVERTADGGPPWRYRGEAATSGDRFTIEATVSGDGNVAVDVSGEARQKLGAELGVELAEKVRRVLRAAWKHAEADGRPPPRRIQRWRADR